MATLDGTAVTTAGTTINGAYGTLVIKADGSYTYTLNNALPHAVNQLNDGQTLTETFNYTAKDGDGSAASSTLVITINGHTDALPKVTTSVAGLGDDLSLAGRHGLSRRRKTSLCRHRAGVGSITLDFTSGGVPS